MKKRRAKRKPDNATLQFRELYIPLLVKSGSKPGRQLNASMHAVRQRSDRRQGFGAMSPERRSAMGRLAWETRLANTSPEAMRVQQLAAASKMIAFNRAKPVERRRAQARLASAARWAGKTTEERRAETAGPIAKAMQGRMAKQLARWPFPDGPRMTRAQALSLGPKANSAAARARRFKKLTQKS